MSDRIKVVRPGDVAATGRSRQNSPLQDFVTRKEMIDGTSNAAMAVGERMFNQFAQETAALLTQMEKDITARVLLEVERRSLRGRLRTLKARVYGGIYRSWFGGWLVETGLFEPFSPNLVEGMADTVPDGTETGEVEAVEGFEWKSFLFWGPPMMAWLESGNVALLDRVIEGKATIQPRLAASTPARLREALEEIVGKGNLGNGLKGDEIVVQLDGDALNKARYLCGQKFDVEVAPAPEPEPEPSPA